MGAHRPCRESRQICTVQHDLTSVRLDQADHAASDGGFARTRLADKTKRLPSTDGEGHRFCGLHDTRRPAEQARSEEHTSELQSLMRISYAVFCLKKKQQ